MTLEGSLAELTPSDVVETCTILTTTANDAVPPIHDGMPVILPPERFDPCLGGESVALEPYPAEAIRIQPVSTHVNKPSNDDPRCIEPIRLP